MCIRDSIEGALIASFAMQAHTAYIYIRGEYVYEREILEAAIKQAYDCLLYTSRCV